MIHFLGCELVSADRDYNAPMVTNRPRQKRGRPSRMTPEVVGKLREVFLLDYNVEEACQYAGIHKDTYYEYLKKNPEFSDEMAQAQRGLAKAAKRAVAIAIIEHKNARIALEYLKHRRPEEYRTKVEDLAPIARNITVILPGSKPHPRIIPAN